MSRIKKNKDRIRSDWQSGTHNDRKRKQSGKNKDVEEGLFLWFEQARSKNVPISGPLLIEKCKKIAEAVGSDFEPNAGWLFCWKKRYNLKYKRAHSESGDADVKGAEEWLCDVYPDIVEGKEPCDVYNCDETALFYRALLDRSYAKKTAIEQIYSHAFWAQ